MAARKKSLDFYVIGAKKAGTTSLYFYLSSMPGLSLHDCKELSFLCDALGDRSEFDDVAELHYRRANTESLWGAVTPHYIYDKTIPGKIEKFMPQGKLVVILRDPIERAKSNFYMMRTQGYELRGFSDVLKTQLSSDELAAQRARDIYPGADLDSYVVWGEYGRLLEPYAEFLERGQLLVVFLEELASEPDLVFRSICNFIGAAESRLPDNLGTKYNDSKKRRLSDSLLYRMARRNRIIVSLAKAIIPGSYLKDLSYRYDLSLTTDVERPVIPSGLESRLIEHYAADVQQLESLIHRKVPWPRFSPT